MEITEVTPPRLAVPGPSQGGVVGWSEAREAGLVPMWMGHELPPPLEEQGRRYLAGTVVCHHHSWHEVRDRSGRYWR